MSARELITDHLDLWTGAVTKKSSSGRGSNGKVELTGIKKLRELILELAVHGKLVEQYPSDTPADQLLERIAERRKELIAAKKIKNSKPLSPVAPDETPSELPAGWAWTRLGSIAEINPRNAGEDTLEASFIPMPLVTTSYHGEHGDEPRNWGEIKKGYTHFANGDVGLAKITPCFENSKAAVFRNLRNGIGAGTTELHVARPLSSAINPYFLLLFLKSPRFLTEGERVMTGSAGQKRVPKDYFSETPLPLPPTEEQHRIVQKVDELMALCDRLEQQSSDQLEAHETLVDTLLGTLTQSENATELADNWTRLAAHFDTLFTTEQSIDKLKQTILQLAVMGRLVEQDEGNESATELLTGIERYKQELIDAKQIKPPKKLPAITPEETVFDIPRNWQWVKFGELGLFINGDRSKNYPNKEEYVERGVAWINTGHIEPDGTLTKTQMNFITREKFDSLRSGKIEPTDLVYCLRGATFGKTAFVTPYEEGAIASSLMIIRPYLPAMRSYIYRYLTSPLGRSQIFRFDNGSAQPNLSANSVMMYAFPLPPLAEQHRIVQKVDELMALCDQLKERINQASETRCQLAEAVVDSALN